MFVRVQEATSDADRQEIYRFRYRVYVEELKKPLPYADHERRLYTDELDEHARLLVAYDENAGTIVGTVRTLFGAEYPFSEELIERMQLAPMIAAIGEERLSHSGIFMVDPAHRGLTIASQLVAHMFQLGLSIGATADICVAELALVRPYYQLGYRPYAPPMRPYPNAGLRVPLVWTGRDREYLASVGSPFAQFLPPDVEDGGAAADEIRPHYPEFRNPRVNPRKLRELWSAIAHSSPAFRPRSLFEGIDREIVDALLGKLPTVTIATGEHFYRKGERERGMGLLLSGKLGVTLDDPPAPFFFSVLVPGELFGEMANVLDGDRTANLVALEDCEILILPDDLIDKIARKQPEVATVVRTNLSALLASRLDAMNHRVVGLTRGNPERFRPNPVPGLGAPTVGAATSYSIPALDDATAELDRLERQATLGQEMEAVWLKRIGFEDGGTILDLGSGLGLTSFLLARVFPQSRIVGLEPDEGLRARAEQRCVELGHEGQCSFVAGTGEELPLSDDSVDFVYSRFLFQHLRRPDRVIAELARVTRSGGVIAVVDVDDAGEVIHPEPPGFRAFQEQVVAAQATLGGDRNVGRKLRAYLRAAGLKKARTDVVPLSSHIFPAAALIDIAFDFKAQTLKRVDRWSPSEARVLEDLQQLSERDDAWVFIPVFLAHASVD